ncbi:glycosyltransferase family 4 protein [Candidatus Saccharibacteria bacterium]|nr:glycosyltransferase family 4 protein [Candidatus Saccharibacteria bacterium]NCS82880.1 glycosyltransferase family 4 protein [Candidatus Saccharibacteria bacterium]
MSQLRVAIIAPPWLPIPPNGYGGIEPVLEGLIKGLVARDVYVEVFSIGASKLPKGAKNRFLYDQPQYDSIAFPGYEMFPIIGAQLQFALNEIINRGFDIIHDHNGFTGPLLLSWATHNKNLPPAVHTFHGPPFGKMPNLPDNTPFWEQLSVNPGRLWYIGISNTLVAKAPEALKPRILPTVYNAIDTSIYPFVADKKDYYITLARFSRDKGQHVAVRLCKKLGARLRMAGTVAGIGTNQKLFMELANPLSPYRHDKDFKYYSDYILPQTVHDKKITYAGNIAGKRKMSFISHSKALLFPIDWDEPFGMAVIEAMACGTPVVAMNRGAMPEIIEHGRNGFLADTEEEFFEYMQRVDEIDPVECRKSVEEKFSASIMADLYIARYEAVISADKKDKST